MSSEKVKNKALLRLAIMSLAFTTQAANVISPALPAFRSAFPEISTTTIQLLVTLPGLAALPFTLLSGVLVRRFPKKRIALTGFCIFLVSALLPILLHSFPLILCCRILSGAGLGMVGPLGNSLAGDYFEGNEVTRVIGLNSVSMCLGGMVCSYLAGVFADVSYNMAFLCYAIAIIPLALIIIGLPDGSVEKGGTRAQGASGFGDYFTIPGKVWLRLLMQFCFCLGYFSYVTNTSLLITMRGLGDSSFSGLTTSVSYVAGILAGLAVGTIRRKLRQGSIPFAVLLMLAGMLIEISAGYTMLINLASFLIGFSYQTVMSCMVTSLTEISKEDGLNRTAVMSLFSITIALGGTFSPIILGNLASVFGLAEVVGQMYIGILILAIVFVCLILYGIWGMRKKRTGNRTS